ncbi:MAG TPA: hypothetical protein VFA92_16195 [Candidatus Binatia bacterium]|nr:hypothetical protein [Candidatus Binatia bacterium]
MAELGRRLQVLIDEGRYRRLEQRAAAEHRAVAALVRDAIDLAYPDDTEDRRAAGLALLALEPMPVGDWPDLKRDVLDASGPDR